MLENLEFIYDGKLSKDMGVINARVDKGLYKEDFLPKRTIRENKIRGRETPYFMGVDKEPLEFSMLLLFEDLDVEKRRSVARWLNVDYYKPLAFKNNPERIFYCMSANDSTHSHAGLDEGYIELKMRCNSPYSYSPIYTSDVYDLSDNNEGGTMIEIINSGDSIMLPAISLEKVGEGNIIISNASFNKKECVMNDLLNGDMLTIDSSDRSIETSISGAYRYDNHNGSFIELSQGVNRINVRGNCIIQLKYQFTFYHG